MVFGLSLIGPIAGENVLSIDRAVVIAVIVEVYKINISREIYDTTMEDTTSTAFPCLIN